MSLLNQTRRSIAKLLSGSLTTTRNVTASTLLFAQRRAYGITAPGGDIPLKAKEPPFAKERRELEEHDKKMQEKKLEDMKTGPVKPAPKQKRDDSGPKPASV